MLKKEEVQHTAKLARLGLTFKELERFRRELSVVLDYIEILKKVDISKTEPTSHPSFIQNIMRKDGIQDEKIKIRKELIEMSPKKEKGYVKVKSVF